MSAGTLTLTNKSAAVTGSGTAFTTELAAGDFAVVTVGGIPYSLPVKSVNSNTSLTLVSNFTGPSQAGAAWYAMPRVAMNLVTAALVTQSAEALRGLNYDKQNWQSVFTASGTITVTLPDGSNFTGPSWKYLADNMATKSGGAVPVNQGGTGSTSAQGARTNLGLGTVATYTVATSTLDWNPNRVLYTGCWGIGAQDCPTISEANAARQGGIVQGGGGIGTNWADAYCPALVMNRSERLFSQIQVTSANRMAWRIGEGGVGWKPWLTAWDSGNTTVDSSGFIKKASPIIKIYSDGHFDINEESEGCTVTRLAVGEYLIEGCTGMNSDASWGGIDGGFDIPQDRNKQPLLWLDYEVNADGSVLVKTYHRTHPDAPAFARNLIGTKDDAGNFTETVLNGELIDIPDDVFISVRVEMPADSVYNLSLLDRQRMELAE
ncbi:phage tail protein [Kluyvera sp. NPDC087067]|uniref:phage tail fiber protein n=1 Tax=Kluyvera sp. NPDC087067 TaxID=3364105 RepID=UPI0037F87944